MTLTAKYSGHCESCRAPIQPGARIEWDKATKRTWHAACAPGAASKVAAIAASRATDAAVDLPAPDGLSYLPFQRAGIARAAELPSVLLADDMGLGKTIQAIGVINADASIRRVLVVCPASLRLNWQRELHKWLVRPLTVGIATVAEWPATDVVITNYDIAAKLTTRLRAEPFDLAILDESQYCKNPKAARTQAVVGSPKRRTALADAGIPARRSLACATVPGCSTAQASTRSTRGSDGI